MTVENQIPSQSFTANGTQSAFAFNFYVEGKDNIEVQQNGNMVSANNYKYEQTTNSILFNIVPKAGDTIEIKRVTPIDRSIQYATYDNSFRPEVLNYDLDRIIRILQELGFISTVLAARLAKEILDRTKGDQLLQDQILQEVEQRLKTDKYLQEQITSNDFDISVLFIGLKQEIKDRIQGDRDVARDARDYTDFMLKMNNSANIFDGIADNIVITENGDSQRKINNKFNNLLDPNTGLVKDQVVQTWSKRSQDDKNKDVVSALDFGVIPDSTSDQTDKFDSFLNYLREHGIKGIIPKGTYIVSCTKPKVFGKVGEADYSSFLYALDISGIDLEGITTGYRGGAGVVIKCSERNGVALFQNSVSVSNTSYRIQGLKIVNAGVVLRMTYALHCDISRIYSDDCDEGIILGEATMAAGAMCNQFSNINIRSTGRALDLRGKTWNNANVFTNCFFTGGIPSRIHCNGGYGALSTTFIGGEFNDITSNKNHGIELGRCSGVNFYGVYFEPHGHAVVLDGAHDVNFYGCTFGSTNTEATESSVPCIIYHRTGSASVTIVGGNVWMAKADGSQDGMRLVYSDKPSSFNLSIVRTPYQYGGGLSKNWGVVDVDNLVNLNSFTGSYTFETPVQFSKEGKQILNLGSDSKVVYQVINNQVQVRVFIRINADSILETGEYYIRSNFLPIQSSQGSALFTVSGVSADSGTISISSNNANMFLRRKRYTTKVDESGKNFTTTENSLYISSSILKDMDKDGCVVSGTLNYIW